jgi:hypothetical protein
LDAWRIPNQDLTEITPLKVRIRTRHSLFRQPKFHSDRFACFRRSFFCWKATSPCRPFSLQTRTGGRIAAVCAVVAVAAALDSILTIFALAPASV